MERVISLSRTFPLRDFTSTTGSECTDRLASIANKQPRQSDFPSAGALSQPECD